MGQGIRPANLEALIALMERLEQTADPIQQQIDDLRQRNAPQPQAELTRGQRFKEGVTGEQGADLAASFLTGTDFSDTGSIASSALGTAGTAIGFGLGGPVGAAAGGFIGGGLGGLLGGDDEDEKERKRRERLILLANLSSFLNASNFAQQQQVARGQSFF